MRGWPPSSPILGMRCDPLAEGHGLQQGHRRLANWDQKAHCLTRWQAPVKVTLPVSPLDFVERNHTFSKEVEMPVRIPADVDRLLGLQAALSPAYLCFFSKLDKINAMGAS